MTKPTYLSRGALIAGAALTFALGACANTMNDDPPSMSLTQSSSARTSTSSSGSSSSSTAAPSASASTSSSAEMAQAGPATPPAEPATAGAATGATVEYTDAQLRSFVAASTAIRAAQPAAGAQPTPDQVAQIRTALESNGLDRDTYNAIATRMRTDAAFNTRVESLRNASGGASASSSTTTPSSSAMTPSTTPRTN